MSFALSNALRSQLIQSDIIKEKCTIFTLLCRSVEILAGEKKLPFYKWRHKYKFMHCQNKNVQSSDTFWGRWGHNVCAQINVIKTNNIEMVCIRAMTTVAIVRTFLLFLRFAANNKFVLHLTIFGSITNYNCNYRRVLIKT